MKIEAGKYYVCTDNVVRKVDKHGCRYSYGEFLTWGCPNDHLKPLTNSKIKIEDEEHYYQVVDMLHEGGFTWICGGKTEYYESFKWLYLNTNMSISWSFEECWKDSKQIYFPKQTKTEQKGEIMKKRELNYEALEGKVIPYSTNEEWEAIYLALEGVGCNMHGVCVSQNGHYKYFRVSTFNEYVILGNKGGNEVSLQEAIQLLLKPKKSKEELEQEKKIEELKETIEKAQKQIQALQNNQ